MKQHEPRLRSINDKRKEKRVDPFYQTKKWQAFVSNLILKRGRRCEHCGRNGTLLRIYADHIVEIKDGGHPFDDNNIQLLCGSCHTAKTLRERARRRINV